MGKKPKTKGGKAGGKAHAAAGSASTAPSPPWSTKRQRATESGEAAAAAEVADSDSILFEDPFEDEFENEEVEEVDPEEGTMDGEMDVDGSAGNAARLGADVTARRGGPNDGEPPLRVETKVWRADVDKLTEGEQLEYDSTAYHMYHSIRPEWPCLSFDIVRDSLGTSRSRFPHTVFAVAGTQADRADNNRLQVMRLSDLHRTAKGTDSGEEDESDDEGPDETDDDPVLDHVNIPHRGGVNRVRSMPQRPYVVATWSETSRVHVWELKEQVTALERSGPRTSKIDPEFTFEGHAEEGFALDWSPISEGTLATGDCANCIHITKQRDGGWIADPSPYIGHEASVEDLQWSPTEDTVFGSASADKTIAFWDIRQKNGAMLRMKAHDEDVNVMSWNRNVTYLLASGSDDGSFKIWDLRTFGKGEPVAQFRWHQGPITSIEWHPTDESMLAAAGADNQLSVWDLSVEADDEAAGPLATDGNLKDLPPQLLFIHQGQTDIKELHFHPQIPGVIMSTAADGFNVFKPATTA